MRVSFLDSVVDGLTNKERHMSWCAC